MTPQEFCYWLQGYFELTGHIGRLQAEQVESIKRHLAMVFAHSIDPAAGDGQVQEKLNAIHQGRPPFGSEQLVRC